MLYDRNVELGDVLYLILDIFSGVTFDLLVHAFLGSFYNFLFLIVYFID